MMMRRLRLLLTGMVIMALLGLSGVAAAGAGAEDAGAAEKAWYHFDKEWQEQNRLQRKYEQDLAVNEAEQAAVGARLAALQTWPNFYAVWGWWNGTVERRTQLANDRLITLQTKHADLKVKERAAFNIRFDIEEDEKRAEAAKKVQSELGRWGIDTAKQGWKDKDVWFSATCILIITKGKTAGDEHSRSTRGAHGAADLADKIKSAPNGCVPNKDYNTRLIIESWVFDSEGKREDLETVKRDGAKYQKP